MASQESSAIPGHARSFNLCNGFNRLVAPTSGGISIAGQDATGLPTHILRRRIGYVFQEVGLFPHMTLAENIAITPRLLGWTPDRISARVANLLGLVDLPAEMATRLPGELSGGQRQRIGVARALAAEPKILLMDEPFGALDPVTRDSLGGDVRALHDQLSLTTVMVTHDMAEAVLLADRIVIMRGGQIVADGTAAALARHADPQVASLMDGPRRQAERLRAKFGAET